EYDIGSYDEAKDVFKFELPTDAKDIDRIEITPKTSVGTTKFPDQENSNRMLSLHEIEIITQTGKPVSEISFDMDKEVYLESITKIDVDVSPKNASNPFYKVTSDNPEIASVLQVNTKDAYEYYLIARKPGKVTLTATSLDDENITSTIEIDVLDEIDVTVIRELIKEVEDLHDHLYTEESLANVFGLVKEAENILEDPASTSVDEILEVTYGLRRAIRDLEFKGSDDSKENSSNLIDGDLLSIHDYTNYADSDRPENIIDKNEDTIWHSSYGSNASLPVQITVDLKDVYELEQIDMLARQENRNGHITQYRVEVSEDGEDYFPVVQGFFEHDGSSLIDRQDPKAIKFDTVDARYVKFIAIEALGDTMNTYASIAELTFYGLPKEKRLAENIEFTEEITEIVVGQEKELGFTVTPEDYNEQLIWTSSDEEVLTVENGRITALKPGKSTITLKGKEALATMEISVVEGNISHLGELVEEVETLLGDPEA